MRTLAMAVSERQHPIRKAIGTPIGAALIVFLFALRPVLADDVKIYNIEYPSRLYADGGAVVTVQSPRQKVECIGYKGGVPVGSGSAYTTAGIANVTILLSKKSGPFTVSCS